MARWGTRSGGVKAGAGVSIIRRLADAGHAASDERHRRLAWTRRRLAGRRARSWRRWPSTCTSSWSGSPRRDRRRRGRCRAALAWNVALFAVFAAHHSLMARAGAKAWLARDAAGRASSARSTCGWPRRCSCSCSLVWQRRARARSTRVPRPWAWGRRGQALGVLLTVAAARVLSATRSRRHPSGARRPPAHRRSAWCGPSPWCAIRSIWAGRSSSWRAPTMTRRPARGGRWSAPATWSSPYLGRSVAFPLPRGRRTRRTGGRCGGGWCRGCTSAGPRARAASRRPRPRRPPSGRPSIWSTNTSECIDGISNRLPHVLQVSSSSTRMRWSRSLANLALSSASALPGGRSFLVRRTQRSW